MTDREPATLRQRWTRSSSKSRRTIYSVARAGLAAIYFVVDLPWVAIAWVSTAALCAILAWADPDRDQGAPSRRGLSHLSVYET